MDKKLEEREKEEEKNIFSVQVEIVSSLDFKNYNDTRQSVSNSRRVILSSLPHINQSITLH